MSRPTEWMSADVSPGARTHRKFYVFELGLRRKNSEFFRAMGSRDFYVASFLARSEIWGEKGKFLFAITKDGNTLVLLRKDLDAGRHEIPRALAETPCPETWEEAKVWLYVASQVAT